MDLAAALRGYRLGYAAPDDEAPTDGGIRAADAYVAAHDPLRGRVRVGDAVADVAIGVDPGRYFCSGLAQALGEGDRPAGFIHVPPDASSLTRPDLLTLIELVARGVLGAILGERAYAHVLLTGFGPFPGVPDNPTAAFAREERRLAAMAEGLGLRITGAVIGLQDPTGAMFAGMAPVRRQLAELVDAHSPDLILALGVDSGQGRVALPRPRFTIETQARGMREPGVPARPVPLEAAALAVLRAGSFRELGEHEPNN